MKAPLVSIILPLYNGAAFIEETLKSLEKQSFQEAELIVIDDESTDDGPEKIRKFCEKSSAPILKSLKLILQKNTGVAGARNHGVELAEGFYLAPLDQDDLWEANRLEEMVNLLQGEKKRWGYSAFTRFYASGKKVLKCDGSKKPSETLEKLVGGGLFIPPSAALVEKSLVLETGGFVSEYAPSDDWDFFLKLAETSDGAWTPKPLVFFRSHKTSTAKRQRATIFLAQEKVLAFHEPLVKKGIAQKFLEKRRAAINLHLALVAWQEDDKKEAKRRFQNSIAANPTRFKTRWLYLKFLLGARG